MNNNNVYVVSNFSIMSAEKNKTRVIVLEHVDGSSKITAADRVYTKYTEAGYTYYENCEGEQFDDGLLDIDIPCIVNDAMMHQTALPLQLKNKLVKQSNNNTASHIMQLLFYACNSDLIVMQNGVPATLSNIQKLLNYKSFINCRAFIDKMLSAGMIDLIDIPASRGFGAKGVKFQSSYVEYIK